MGVPLLPLLLPGRAISPGTRSWSLLKAAALTVIEGLVFEVLLLSVTSLAVKVALPAVLKVTLRVWLPLDRAALTGKAVLRSEALRPTVSVMSVRRFQFASTALIVTLKAVPAVCALGVPVLPFAAPADAVSPGAKSNNFVNAPGTTATLV